MAMEGASEQNNILQAISTAIEMELDWRQCYLAAIKVTTNHTGRKLLMDIEGQFKGDVFWGKVH